MKAQLSAIWSRHLVGTSRYPVLVRSLDIPAGVRFGGDVRAATGGEGSAVVGVIHLEHVLPLRFDFRDVKNVDAMSSVLPLDPTPPAAVRIGRVPLVFCWKAQFVTWDEMPLPANSATKDSGECLIGQVNKLSLLPVNTLDEPKWAAWGTDLQMVSKHLFG